MCSCVLWNIVFFFFMFWEMPMCFVRATIQSTCMGNIFHFHICLLYSFLISSIRSCIIFLHLQTQCIIAVVPHFCFWLSPHSAWSLFAIIAVGNVWHTRNRIYCFTTVKIDTINFSFLLKLLLKTFFMNNRQIAIFQNRTFYACR